MSMIQPVATDNNGQKETLSYPAVAVFFSKFFSWIFHPLFIPLYVTWYLVFVNQEYFVGLSPEGRKWILLRVTLNMIFFPAFTVLLLRGVGFIESVFLKTQRDRIIPYIAAGVFFFWMYLVFRNQAEIPLILTSFTFGVFLASSVALIANIYFKISMHAIGCGGMIGLMLITAHNNSSATLPFIVVFLIAGIVCTSRMIVSDHNQRDIYLGLLCGVLTQFISVMVIA